MFSFKSALGLVALLPLAQLVAAQSPVWGQCGGIGWTGATTCGAFRRFLVRILHAPDPSSLSPQLSCIGHVLPQSQPSGKRKLEDLQTDEFGVSKGGNKTVRKRRMRVSLSNTGGPEEVKEDVIPSPAGPRESRGEGGGAKHWTDVHCI